MSSVYLSASFDDLRSPHVRLFDEASRLGDVHALLWSDALVRALDGREPKFPEEERRYFLESIRYVSRVTVVEHLPSRDILPPLEEYPGSIWAVDAASASPAREAFCRQHGLTYQVISADALKGFPFLPSQGYQAATGVKKVLVTGCYDWLHSGHVRFFEEVSQLGDLYVVVGNDANVRHLKGEGHPMLSQDERRYMVQAIRFVKETLITSGMGWMDAEPEIAVVQPDSYVVNEDGDKPEKRAFCAEHGLEYVVLKRLPKEGLPRRESTNLRGF